MTTQAPRQTYAPVASLRRPTDHILFAATLMLVVIGLWMVFDTSYVKLLDAGSDAYTAVRQQATGWVAGLAALFVMMNVGYWRLRRFAAPCMAVALILLLLVYLPPVGVHVNHAARWIRYPIRWQPSEFAKLALVFYLAAILSRPTCEVRQLGGQGLGPPLLVTAFFLFLIDREPDLGTAAVLFLAVLTQFFMAGARKRHLALMCIGAGLFILLFGFTFGHRGNRLTAYMHLEDNKKGVGYQIYHSRLAIGSGGIFGMGVGQGREKYYLPEANSDFIFATMAEELGLMGTLPLLGLLCLVCGRGFRIACQTKDRFGSLLAAGIAALISWQALINIAVATASIPATGVPLPFISNGSSSLVFLLAGVGILLNIAQHPTPPGQAVTTAKRA